MKDKNIILLGVEDDTTKAVFNALNNQFGVRLAIIENRESLKIFLRRRIKKLGIIIVVGQVAFQLIIVKVLKLLSKKRYNTIIKENNLILDKIPVNKIKYVSSINNISTIALIKTINPDLIIVNGTRIISKKVLQCVNCKFINIHSGITPMYRGVHGTYWALVNNDGSNSGVTVHFVDEGIDTGGILSQKVVIPLKLDNFSTYPILQLCTGIKLLKEVVTNYFENKIITINSVGKSKLYYHPTIWTYLYNRIIKKVK